MGLLDRVALLVYSLALTVLSAVFVAVAAGWEQPLEFIGTSLASVNGRWVTGIVSGVLLLVSIRFLAYVFTPRRRSQGIQHETELGHVHVRLDAVENLVKRAARQVRGVRDVRAKVGADESGISVRLKATVTPDTNIPEAAREIQQSLRTYVKNVVGVAVSGTDILIENISSESRRGRE